MEHSCERKWESMRVYFDSGHWYFGGHAWEDKYAVYHCPYCGVKLEPPVKVEVNRRLLTALIEQLDAASSVIRGVAGSISEMEERE